MNWQNGLQDLFIDRLYEYFLREKCTRIIHSGSDQTTDARTESLHNVYCLDYHNHDEIEVSIVLRGEYLLDCANRHFHLRPGDISVIAPDEEHRDRVFSHDAGYELAVIGIKGNCICLYYCGYSSEDGYFGVPAHTWMVLIDNVLLDSMYRELAQRESNFENCFYTYLKAFYLYLRDTVFSGVGFETPMDFEYQLFQRITQYIDNNANRSLRTGDVCRHFGLNEQYLCRLYRKYTHSTISEAVNYQRTIHAIELLRDKQKKISDIAFEVGYGDQCYFSRIFKNMTGLSPSDFRDRLISTSPTLQLHPAVQQYNDVNERGTFYKRYLPKYDAVV